jgi:hypothetical protein
MSRFSIDRRVGLFVAALGLSAAAHATSLTFEGTVLMGAKGVLVGSNFYDVTFGDQPLVFSDYFTAPADNDAANALYTSLVDAYKADAHQVTSINGCTGDCVAVIMSSDSYQATYNYAAYLSFVSRPTGIPSYLVTENFAIHPNTNMGSVSGETWTHWTMETTPVTPVPEPETYAMLLAGLGLISAAVKRHNAERS